LLVKFVQFNVI